MTLIIAEAGVNHNGDMEIAKRLIDTAAQAGADLVKFQTFSADKIVGHGAPKAAYQEATTGTDESQLDMVRALELSHEQHHTLAQVCLDAGIGFFSTAFDTESFDFLCEMGLDRVKVPSGEITNLPLLRHMAAAGLPTILSTGMATLGDIEAALGVLESNGLTRDAITILHCNTEYPTPMQDVNLRAMRNIGTAFGTAYGYSDHTLGIEIPIAAVALGASVIEKHITMDRTMSGPDHAASLEPDDLAHMVSAIRNVEKAMAGDGIKRPSPSEIGNRKIARKSIVAATAIAAGEVFSAENLGTKRPGTGISPMQWDDVIGRRATRAFAPDEMIEV